MKTITRSLLTSTFITLVMWSGFSQKSSILQNTNADTVVAWVSQNLQKKIIDSVQFINIAHKAIKLSKENDNQALLADSYRNIATWFLGERTIDSTVHYLEKALAIYRQKSAELPLAETHLELEDAYKQRANYSQAMVHNFEALALYEKINNPRGLANCYTRLCDLMYYQEKYQEGANYCQKAIDIQKSLDAPDDLAISYRYKADNLLILNQYEDALQNINEALIVLKNAEKTEYEMMPVYNTRGNIYKYMERYDEALGEYMKNYELCKEGHSEHYLIPTLGNIGHVYRLQENYAAALPYTLEAIDIVKKTGNTQNLWENYLHAAGSYEALEQYQKALYYYQLYAEEDANRKNDIIEQLESELQIKYETAKKDEIIHDQDAQISQHRITQILSISIAGLLAIILLGMYYTLKNIRKKREVLKSLNLELERKRKDVETSNAALSKSLDDLQATQAQLIHSEKMASLGELTAGIAHEIQNPLNFVNNFSDVSGELLEEAEEELKKGEVEEVKEILKDLKQNLSKIHHHGDRASSIVKGMLAHSRSGSGEKVLTDINALCDEYLRLAYHGMRAKDKSFNASFESDFEPSLPRLEVVPQEIGRVLLNLINNAFAAVRNNPPDRKPIVKVSTHIVKEQVEIIVLDNGPGIPDEIKDKIFQPFFTTKPTGEGTGLGLSLSYDIVKAHGGELKVQSEPGKDTKFTFVLPFHSVPNKD